jgi:hypothetical protein
VAESTVSVVPNDSLLGLARGDMGRGWEQRVSSAHRVLYIVVRAACLLHVLGKADPRGGSPDDAGWHQRTCFYLEYANRGRG